jgi:CRISPR-associated endonuclease/helicase Cas3
MCAEHRTKILATIKYNLANGLPCKVVSTSLIEAGVDVDFPCVMRAEAGLDSIAQAAGRCNRERLYSKENSIVYAFTSSEWEIPTELRELSAGTRAIFRKYPNDILCMDAITDYFKEVYWLKATELDKNNSLERYYQNHAPEISFPFQEIAKEFKLIDTVMQPVFIPFDDESNKLIELLRIELQIGPILRKLQRYIVQVPLKSFDILAQSGAVSAIAPERFGEQFWYLINPDIYSHAYGLSWSNPTFMEIEKMII